MQKTATDNTDKHRLNYSRLFDHANRRNEGRSAGNKNLAVVGSLREFSTTKTQRYEDSQITLRASAPLRAFKNNLRDQRDLRAIKSGVALLHCQRLKVCVFLRFLRDTMLRFCETLLLRASAPLRAFKNNLRDQRDLRAIKSGVALLHCQRLKVCVFLRFLRDTTLHFCETLLLRASAPLRAFKNNLRDQRDLRAIKSGVSLLRCQRLKDLRDQRDLRAIKTKTHWPCVMN
ncbi:MAG TPA: hypothetical protein VK177_21310 [Flavobacteriales bacterium]|nr:hypothetical protein [Flavobacteriales bacterium]